MTEVIFRDQASSLGLKRYFTGVPCRNNHLSERSAATGRCLECAKADRLRIGRLRIGRSPKIGRQRALQFGHRTYNGYRCRHCRCNEKYVDGASCTTCFSADDATVAVSTYQRAYRQSRKEKVREKYKEDRALLLAAKQLLKGGIL